MINTERLKQLSTHPTTKVEESDEPSFCTKEYEEHCHECEYILEESVCHPGGCSTHAVEKYSCNLGYWEDDF